MVSNYRIFHDKKDYDIGFTIKRNNKMVAENLKACKALKVIFVNVRGEDDEQQHFL